MESGSCCETEIVFILRCPTGVNRHCHLLTMTNTLHRSLFHSFPRPKSTEDPSQTVNRGLEILRYMFDVGIVLAPEAVTWQHPYGDPTILVQKRACFTELSQSELPEHAKTFGPFTLQFSSAKLRSVGAMPVIYAPQAIPGHPSSELAEFCVKAATHTKYVLERLEELKKLALNLETGYYEGKPVHPQATIRLQNVDPAGNVVGEYSIKPTDISGLMRYVGFRNIPLDHSIAMLGVYENMFYPTDNTHANDQLGYYRQREWRLISSSIAMEGVHHTRSLTPHEQTKLEAIDISFWSRSITVGTQTASRSSIAQVFTPPRNLRLSDLVEKIYVPASAEFDVRKIFNGNLEIM